MSTELELLWPLSLLLLLLLGSTAWLCVRCARQGVKKTGKIYEQRNQQENEQSCTVSQTYSLARQVWPGPLTNTASEKSSERKNKLMFSHLEGSRHDPDTAYVDPIPTDYYNWGCFQKPPEGRSTCRSSARCLLLTDDSVSYENVLICKPSTRASGGEESEDYQNSASIHQWRESRKTVGAQMSPSEGPEEEPDYVNGDVAAAEEI
ncbi:linker for activation of T-cells family member 2 isoform X5 [Meriones unguiculatus]|uniref:linker for activation of T-cells family member 2 isoform X5 n=1 Tax=Meriones unguiculatus TaxID=10047 RepID=UPI000B4EE198|nr:linker for activation of T-cells family member 2 isoform X5 [Meriones unguiculatus]